MPEEAMSRFIKIVVTLEPREDGGLYAYSNDVPGFVLSHSNPEAVRADIKPAREGILTHLLKTPVTVKELGGLDRGGTQAAWISRVRNPRCRRLMMRPGSSTVKNWKRLRDYGKPLPPDWKF
jgi:hypothetical protein